VTKEKHRRHGVKSPKDATQRDLVLDHEKSIA
jgi:hypothetical protein